MNKKICIKTVIEKHVVKIVIKFTAMISRSSINQLTSEVKRKAKHRR